MALRETVATARILKSERNKDWLAADAVCELVDNSFGFDRGNADNVIIDWDSNRKVMTVTDDGRGVKALSYMFTLGDGENGTNRDIGRYGQGGSAAMLWLADRVSVTTIRDGKLARSRQDFVKLIDSDNPRWPQVDDDAWVQPTANNAPASLIDNGAGTEIRMVLRRKFVPAVMMRKLSQVYAAGLSTGKTITFVHNGSATRLQAWEPDPNMAWDPKFEVDVDGLKAQVRVGISDKVSVFDAGLSVTFGYREIFKNKKDFLDGWSGGKVFGYVDLEPEWHPYLSNNKTAIADDDKFDKLVESVKAQLGDVLALLKQDELDDYSAKLEGLLKTFPGLRKKLTRKPQEPKPMCEVCGQKPCICPCKKCGQDPCICAKPERKPKLPKDGEDRGGMEIEVKADPTLDGLRMKADISDTRLEIRYDPESDIVKSAIETKPFNGLLMRLMLADVVAEQLVSDDKVVAFGLFSEEDWETKQEQAAGCQLTLAAFVKPRMLAAVQDTALTE